MMIIKQILKSGLKHFIGKYLVDKNLLDDLKVVGKQIELKNIELDTNELYSTSKKYLHDSFNRITVQQGVIDHIVVSLSSELIDNIYIRGVHLKIKTTNEDIDVVDAKENSVYSESHNNPESDSIFAFEDNKVTYSDDSSSTSTDENTSPLKTLFSKTKRNISLISKILKQLGNVTILIVDINVEIDDFLITSKANKITIGYNANHPNELFPFDVNVNIDGLCVQLRGQDKSIIDYASIDINLDKYFVNIKSIRDIELNLNGIVIGTIIKLVKHITKPLKRIRYITKQFRQHMKEESGNVDENTIKAIHLDVSGINVLYPISHSEEYRFRLSLKNLKGDAAKIPKKIITSTIEEISIVLSEQTHLCTRGIELGFTYNESGELDIDVGDGEASDEDDIVIAESPFDDDKLRLFHSVLKPHPVGCKQQRQNYSQKTRKTSNVLVQFLAQYTNIEFQSIKVVDEMYQIINEEVQFIVDLIKEEDANSKLDVEMFKSVFQESIFEKNQQFTIDTTFKHITVKDHTSTYLQMIAQDFKAFVCNRYWFGDVVNLDVIDHSKITPQNREHANTSVGHLKYASFAGSIPFKHISLDAKKVEIDNINKIIQAVKVLPMQQEGGVIDFYFRIFKFNLRHDKFYLKLQQTELFNAKDMLTLTDHVNVTCNKLILYREKEGGEYKFLSQFQIVQYTCTNNTRNTLNTVGTTHKLSINDSDLFYTIGTHLVIGELIDTIKTIVSSVTYTKDLDDNSKGNKDAKATEEIVVDKTHENTDIRIIDDYCNSKGAREKEIPFFQINILKYSCTFAHPNSGASNNDQVVVVLNRFGLELLENSMDITCSQIEMIDRLSTSVWNKAVKIKNLSISKSEGLLSIASKEYIRFNVDQDIILFFTDFIPTPSNTETNIDEQQSTSSHEGKGLSVHISKLDVNINYKHKHTPRDSPFYWLTVLNFIPIRDSKVHIDEFDGFGIHTFEHFYTMYLKHSLQYIKQDLGGLIKGIKPIKPLTSVVAEGCKLILVPVNAVRGESIERLANQVKSITSKSAVSVLEIGGSLQTADYYQNNNSGNSVFHNQPQTIKDGLVQGQKSFTDGMTTIVTFVTDDNADLFQLPTVLVKPFTGFLANTFLGACNQIDPERYQRMKDLYK